jgi:hypothetical protein
MRRTTQVRTRLRSGPLDDCPGTWARHKGTAAIVPSIGWLPRQDAGPRGSAHAPDPHRSTEGGRVDHPATLDQLHLAGRDQPARRPARRLHQRLPVGRVLTGDRPCGLRRADRRAGTAWLEQAQDGGLEVAIHRPDLAATAGIRTETDLGPITRPRLAPAEGPPAAGAALVLDDTHVSVSHPTCDLGGPGRAPVVGSASSGHRIRGSRLPPGVRRSRRSGRWHVGAGVSSRAATSRGAARTSCHGDAGRASG